MLSRRNNLRTNVAFATLLAFLSSPFPHVARAEEAPFKADGSAGVADLAGYEGFDERQIPMPNSPRFSLDEELTDLCSTCRGS